MSNTPAGMQHTPGPWTVAETFDNDGAHETVIRACGGQAAVAVTLDFGPNNPGMRIANAAFIVRACNSYEQLLAALKLQRGDHQRFSPHHAHLCQTCIATDAAFAAAEVRP